MQLDTSPNVKDQLYINGGRELVRLYLLLQVLMFDHLQGKVLSELVAPQDKDIVNPCHFNE